MLELGLRKPDPPTPPAARPEAGTAAPIKGVVEAFLRAFSEFAPDASERDVAEFARTVADCRAQIAEATHEQEARRLAAQSVKACEQFLRQSRHYYATREAELTEMIAILRQAARHIAGDSADFNAQMRETSERFKGIAQLDDIRDLKRKLADEATTLQRTIEAKQRRDEEALSALTERVETLQAHLVQAEEQAALDPLTRIANRGTFDRSLAKLVKTARSRRAPLALAMLDIDHFKKINDTHGHPIGDRVLLCAAQWLSSAVRQTDVVARYGGEEFAIILPDADLGAAEVRFRKVLENIAGRSFEYEVEGETRSVRFTVSCGISQLTGQEPEQDLVQRADQALYDAKNQGRNRVVSRKRSVLGAIFG